MRNVTEAQLDEEMRRFQNRQNGHKCKFYLSFHIILTFFINSLENNEIRTYDPNGPAEHVGMAFGGADQKSSRVRKEFGLGMAENPNFDADMDFNDCAYDELKQYSLDTN